MSHNGRENEMVGLPIQTPSTAVSVFPIAITYPRKDNSLEAQVASKYNVPMIYSRLQPLPFYTEL